MITCICVDSNKKSRDLTVNMLRKIAGLRLHGSYASIDTALRACAQRRIDMLFVHLYSYPIPSNEANVINNILKCGTQLILLSGRIGIAGQADALNAADFVMLPTSSVRLKKSVQKALKKLFPE